MVKDIEEEEKAVVKSITKGIMITAPRNTETLPTGTMPNILSPALIQIMPRQMGIFHVIIKSSGDGEKYEM